ncbi:elongation factor P hydroxylase [Serratia symbiotica]|uniref:Elongation factor P hydroxylase n=1 Tax=Serratia symbiotica SCt-VLC TaxID=1347341 RepID=A0A068RE62_9GAMM|nr:elongation factor P hydroxylase [Serratia symbiotica]CDG49206.1 Elongation factor P hydroxylase [Serratia symbiotica SCt-VLC]
MLDTQVTHQYAQLIAIFNQCFSEEYNTRLVKGNDEPIYLPADSQLSYHRIVFAHGFYASGLHEISHWCIAGEERRKLVDFGYWYCPDGRDAQTQSEFEAVEIKPQVLEWMFCVAAGFPFNVSCDNLNGDCEPDRIAFQRKVRDRVLRLLEQEIPTRAARFIQALQAFYNTPPLVAEHFPYPENLN